MTKRIDHNAVARILLSKPVETEGHGDWVIFGESDVQVILTVSY